MLSYMNVQQALSKKNKSESCLLFSTLIYLSAVDSKQSTRNKQLVGLINAFTGGNK